MRFRGPEKNRGTCLVRDNLFYLAYIMVLTELKISKPDNNMTWFTSWRGRKERSMQGCSRTCRILYK